MFLKIIGAAIVLLSLQSQAQVNDPRNGLLQQIYQQNVQQDQQLNLIYQELRNLSFKVDQGSRPPVCPPSNPMPTAYYCTAQCKGNSSTIAGGRGKSEAEAQAKAFDAVREEWGCQMEVVKCTPEYTN